MAPWTITNFIAHKLDRDRASLDPTESEIGAILIRSSTELKGNSPQLLQARSPNEDTARMLEAR